MARRQHGLRISGYATVTTSALPRVHKACLCVHVVVGMAVRPAPAGRVGNLLVVRAERRSAAPAVRMPKAALGGLDRHHAMDAQTRVMDAQSSRYAHASV